ncbi:unnamed protein product [Didymodactylos carnosus]|uniref:Uncharacterized protein n=1 Tax=Didymodactylos carnosus TaxID=1234261 RepID=A0A813XJI2_9BILA|nr:unnamed protein product [Didymodactylos carnosus]CAF1219423.1 unnamed protein product [Didymodactylos carnosus]CAF3653651.1 unnamed protein product [Didymodactylos carnosus]CAF4027636.1 unnamed protein product [Didymodactylos carnosus]
MISEYKSFICSECERPRDIVCKHCSRSYCEICASFHRAEIFNQMRDILNQMTLNREQGIKEVKEFIEKQAQDAKDQARILVEDVIRRVKYSLRNIDNYVEERRIRKLNRLNEALKIFDKDFELLQTHYNEEKFLSSKQLCELRSSYAANMFEQRKNDQSTIPTQTEEQKENEIFFKNYRLYKDLLNLREKWSFLKPAMTTSYHPDKKEFTLDKVLTFLEYRHDRIIDDYREYLETKNKLPVDHRNEALLNTLSFFQKKSKLVEEAQNFSYCTSKNTNDKITAEESIAEQDDTIYGSLKLQDNREEEPSSWNSSNNSDYDEDEPSTVIGDDLICKTK